MDVDPLLYALVSRPRGYDVRGEILKTFAKEKHLNGNSLIKNEI